MSEYQYYEFAAIDGPISEEGMCHAEGCSSRAQVSRYRWRNTYHFDDFHGSVETLLKYYDAHFYIANWGTVRLGLAFPEGCLNLQAVRPYLRGGKQYEDTLTVQEVGERSIVWWERNDDDGWGWTEGEDIIDQLIGIREELMRGDNRALFLGWLADFDPDEWQNPKDDSALVPPIPADLNQLSSPLNKLIEHFPVNSDALAIAGELSQAVTRDRIPIATALENLSASDMRVLLQRVAQGDGSRVMSELNRLTWSVAESPSIRSITCAEFVARTIKLREVRHEREAKAAEAKRKREEEIRRQRLVTVMERADTIWAGLDALMDEKIASAYDQAAAQIQELRDAHDQAGDSARFQEKLGAFRVRYARRPAMMRRIEKL